MSWQDKATVKKGNIGESIINTWLLSKGYVPYMPDRDGGAHPFDRLCASKDKRIVFIAEVKSKPARVYYPDTGIDIRHYEDYRYIRDRYHLNVFIFFVDEDAKQIYGNTLTKLEKPRSIMHKGKLYTYPLKHNGIIYFPLEAMVTVSTLSDEQAKELTNYSTRKADYTGAR